MVYIFDADGTLRRCTVPGQPCPHREGEWEVLPGVRERLSRIDWRTNGFGIASNQAGVAKGYLSLETAYTLLCDLTTALLERWPPIGSLRICPHPTDAGCSCRKPKPRMLLDILETYATFTFDAVFVGDLPSDEQAAKNAGVRFEWAWDFFGRSREEWIADVGLPYP